MLVVNNEKTIQRNARIGQVTTILSLAILAGGMYLSFQDTEKYFIYSITALLIGFILSQIGIYFTNRWGRRPRPDEHISSALKGLDKRYSLYHYMTPASHLLLGPAGVWVLLPKHQRGTITYEKNRWKQKGGGLLVSYLKIFAQEGIGRPDLEIVSEIDVLQKFLNKNYPDIEVPEIEAALVFSNEDADIQADDAPSPTLHMKKLKDFIRKTAKAKPVSMDTITQLRKSSTGSWLLGFISKARIRIESNSIIDIYSINSNYIKRQ